VKEKGVSSGIERPLPSREGHGEIRCKESLFILEGNLEKKRGRGASLEKGKSGGEGAGDFTLSVWKRTRI